jgi:flagellar biosynthesis protein FlhF
MKLKKYIADNLEQAVRMIRSDLGEHAVVLSTKEIKTGGFFGFWQKRKLEIVAAVDEKQNSAAVSQDDVMRELAELKSMFRQLTAKQQENSAIPKHVQPWVDRLKQQEVDEEVIQFILKKLFYKSDINQQSGTTIQGKFKEIVQQLIEDGISKEPVSRSSVELITLVGPTGVGKTTTIAKLAAREVLFNRNKVGFLTADTFRIAAVEQLRTYANILNVPIQVVESPEQMLPSMEALKHCQIIFMDSAGRNYLDDQYIEEVNRFLSHSAKTENYLVLSMTSRWQDMKEIMNKMKDVQIDKLILTKWDESTCFGAALNLLYHYPYPLSFITVGQGVPEDIMAADSCYIANKILGVEEHE